MRCLVHRANATQFNKSYTRASNVTGLFSIQTLASQPRSSGWLSQPWGHWQHGRNLVGYTGDVSRHFFRRGGHNMLCSPTFFSLFFSLFIWRGFKNNSDVCHVLSEELFMLDGRPNIVKMMLKQSLVWYHWFR